MHDDLGIKTDIDFRSTKLTESPIGSDVQFVNDYRIGSYTTAFSRSSLYDGVLRTFADIDNYPIYFHCWGGADRTGTVAFVLEALCGVSETDLAIDFELTSFSIFGKRYRYDDDSFKYASTVAKLKAYEGSTLQEKAENYAMTTLGLTRAEISNIQSILSGNAVVFEKKYGAVVGRNTKLPLKNLGSHTVSAVTVNGKAAEFTLSENILTVKATEVGEGIITFEDGNTLAFDAQEFSDCKIQTLGEGFTRLTMQDTEFVAGETYQFPVTIAEDGDYAVFLNKEGTENNNFKVTLKQGETVVSLTNGGSAIKAYGYNYVRTDACDDEASDSATLTAGDWILNITPVADTTVTYIDIRSTAHTISGAPQAIYPSDYNTYTPDIGYDTFVNGQISKNPSKVLGYNYIGDYANSALAAPHAGDRQILVDAGTAATYKLNVKQAGTYTITFNQSFYLSNATSITEDKDVTLTVTAGNNEAVTKTHTFKAGGTSAKTTAEDEAMEVSLSAGVQTLTFASSVGGTYLHHLTVEKSAESLSDKVVTVDNNLTRIEADASDYSITAGACRGFDFSVPVDGNYNFYGHIAGDEMEINVFIKNLDTQEMTTVYDGTLSIINPPRLRRLGMGKTPSVALTANTNYRMYIVPGVDIEVPFVDVMNVTLPISGKIAISPQYYSATNITDGQINCRDQKNQVTPENGYTLVGNFLSEELTAQSGFNTGYALTPHISNEKNFTYTLNVTKAGVYQIKVDAGAYASSNAYTDSEVLEFIVDGVTATANYTKTDGGVERLTGPSVYLTEGTHTLKLNNPKDGKAGFYLHQILFTPVAGAGAEINGSRATVSAYLDGSYTGVAMIAMYSVDNELVALTKADLKNENYISAEVTLSGTPVAAKVFVWDNFTTVAPLTENLIVTNESVNWKTKS